MEPLKKKSFRGASARQLKRLSFIFACAALVLLFAHFYITGVRPPEDFPEGQVITIPKGGTLGSVAEMLQELHVVRSGEWLKIIVALTGGQASLDAGDYFMEKRENAFVIASRLKHGTHNLVEIKVTIPEGSTIADISKILKGKLSRFDSAKFKTLTKGKEGYLFPDTYFFLPNATTEQVVKRLEDTFNERIKELEREIALFKKPLKDVVIMASILEKEARLLQTKRAISGILWERLRIGMALQVDAVFPYINGKNTYELTTEDLAVDSPYNTYLHTGLPPGPIANPGFDSLKAAVTPIASPYLYYLTDKEGNIYYARTHDEHVANKAKYLR